MNSCSSSDLAAAAAQMNTNWRMLRTCILLPLSSSSSALFAAHCILRQLFCLQADFTPLRCSGRVHPLRRYLYPMVCQAQYQYVIIRSSSVSPITFEIAAVAGTTSWGQTSFSSCFILTFISLRFFHAVPLTSLTPPLCSIEPIL